MLNYLNKTIYGNQQFEPVIIELVNSAPLQRLKHICQHGPNSLAWPKTDVVRYDHSLGVFLLLRKLGAPLEEQIAGLLHDVSHGVFSHALDFVYGTQRAADFQDRIHDKFVLNSILPSILSKYGYDVKRLTNHHLFPLLESPIPNLCADRLDYLCRDSSHYNLANVSDVKKIINSLIIHNQEIICDNQESARLMGELFIKTSVKAYSGPQTIFFHEMIAKAIKIALDKRILKDKDLFTTDFRVLDRLKSSNDPHITECLALISSKTKLRANNNNFDYHLTAKIRYIDPKILINNKAVCLSRVDSSYAKELEAFIEKQRQGHFIKLVQ